MNLVDDVYVGLNEAVYRGTHTAFGEGESTLILENPTTAGTRPQWFDAPPTPFRRSGPSDCRMMCEAKPRALLLSHADFKVLGRHKKK